MTSVFYTAGDGTGWAIDEDLRLIRESVQGLVEEVPLARARVVHSPFWVGLGMHDPELLTRRHVIAHADNPPFFYLTQPDFLLAQRVVRLWVARSTEAFNQFRALRLPVRLIPYAIDPALFFPLSDEDRRRVRSRLGLPEGAFVIGNFHRDSEGSNLHSPKLQKAPELLLLICQKLKASGANIHVLLAGPRRHWIRRALTDAGIPYTFAGRQGITGDDLRENILPREELNELYNACDVHVVPSRWEGGPQSVMECAAARVKTLSTPVGVARDILEPESLFQTASEAAGRLLEDIARGVLAATIEKQHAKWKAAHTLDAMRGHLRDLYREYQATPPPAWLEPVRDALREARWQVLRRLPQRRIRRIAVVHQNGHDACLDKIVPLLRRHLAQAGLLGGEEADFVIAGFVAPGPSSATPIDAQLASPDTCPSQIHPRACVLFPSAQDAVNFREAGGTQPALVCPIVEADPGGDRKPLLVESERESHRILEALASGRPVVHPAALHYTQTVYHGGIAYGEPGPDRDRALQMATSDAEDLARLARIPDGASTATFFHALYQNPCTRRSGFNARS